MTRDEFFSGSGNNGPKAESPVVAEINYNGKDHKFNTYNYESKEKSDATLVGKKFMYLLEASSIGGYNTDRESYLSSPGVLNLMTDQIAVFARGSSTPLASGKYSDIKDEISDMGGKFQKNLYLMSEQGSVVRVVLSGAALNSWITFKGELEDKKALQTNFLVFDELGEGKKGAVKYSFPQFKIGDVSTLDCNDAFSKSFAYVSDRVRPLQLDGVEGTDTSNIVTNSAAQQLAASEKAMSEPVDVSSLPF